MCPSLGVYSCTHFLRIYYVFIAVIDETNRTEYGNNGMVDSDIAEYDNKTAEEALKSVSY